MGKRKREDKEDKLAKELRKLKRKIEKLSKCSNVSSRTRSPSPEPGTPELPQVEELVETQDGIDQLEILPEELDVETLSAMGSVETSIKSGPPIHEEIATRWIPILSKGLNKEEKTLLTGLYTPFSNLTEMIPPRLNPELLAALTEPVKRRDNIIENRQRSMSIALTAMGLGLQCFLKKGDKVEGIKHFNDAARLICDIFHGETESRRVLIQNVVNKEMKPSLQDEPDVFLFGKSLTERIKSAKAVQRSAQELTYNSLHTNNKPNKPFNQRSLNWRAPPAQGHKQYNNYRPNYQYKTPSGGVKKKMNRPEFKKPRQAPHYHRNYKK